MPWSVKAEQLLRQQYAAVGAAARAALPAAAGLLGQAQARGLDVAELSQPDRGPAGRRGAVQRRLPAVLLAGSTVWTGCGWPRSSCWPPSGTRITSGSTAGTWRWPTGWPARRPG